MPLTPEEEDRYEQLYERSKNADVDDADLALLKEVDVSDEGEIEGLFDLTFGHDNTSHSSLGPIATRLRDAFSIADGPESLPRNRFPWFEGLPHRPLQAGARLEACR